MAAGGDYSAMTLSRRQQQWGQGYLAILVDGFGPRGYYPQGFPRFSYFSRPEALNEVTVPRSTLMVRSRGFASATM